MDLSIIIPCHTEGILLNESINSVLAQKWLPDNYEILLIEDHVDKETFYTLEKFRNTSNVRILKNRTQRGAAGSRNLGLENSDGKWVAFLDADDFWSKDSVWIRWQAIQNHRDAQWICGDFSRIDQAGHVFLESFYLSRPVQPYRKAYNNCQPLRIDSPIKAVLFDGDPWTGCVMVQRKAIFNVGGFDPSLETSEDTHLWIKLAKSYSMLFVPKILAFYRKRAGSLTNRKQLPRENTRKMLSMLLKDESFNEHRNDIKKRINQCIIEDMWHCRHNKIFHKALQLNIMALKYSPGRFSLWRNLLGAILKRA